MERRWWDERYLPHVSSIKSTQTSNIEREYSHTLRNLLSTVYLINLFLQDLVTLLTDSDDLFTSNTQLGYGFQDLLGDSGGILVLCKGVWVVESVIYSWRVSAWPPNACSLLSVMVVVVLLRSSQTRGRKHPTSNTRTSFFLPVSSTSFLSAISAVFIELCLVFGWIENGGIWILG